MLSLENKSKLNLRKVYEVERLISSSSSIVLFLLFFVDGGRDDVLVDFFFLVFGVSTSISSRSIFWADTSMKSISKFGGDFVSKALMTAVFL